MKVKPKKNLELPPDVRSFTERVLNTPFSRLSEVLSGFSWKYEKGDFYHWVPLFNYFDAYFEKCIAGRSDIELQGYLTDHQFPSENTAAVLRVTARILENCTNKHLYDSYEHLTSLLAAPDQEVVTCALHALVACLWKNHNSSVRTQRHPALTTRLLDICKGWGGKEQGLDMLTCAHDNEEKIRPYIESGTALDFKFYSHKSSGGLKTIHLADLQSSVRSEHQILFYLIKEYNVPVDLRFQLLTRIRIAKKFSTLEGRRQLIVTRLLAFTVLMQSSPTNEEITNFFSSEPELTSEMVDLIQTDEGIPLELRTLALRAMTVQLIDRSRHNEVISAVGSGGQNGILATLLQESIECIVPSDGGTSSKRQKYDAVFVDALLFLIVALISSASGNVALNEAGFIPSLLPLIRDRNPSHVSLVCTAVKILEGFMDYSSTASAMVRGMGGLSTMIARLEAEVQVDDGAPSSSQGVKRKKGNGEADGGTQVSYPQRQLMKSLLRAIALGSYAPTVGTPSRPEEQDAKSLYNCLRAIFVRSKEFGGALFGFAATVATDLIHQDPLSYGALDEAGVPDAFLEAVQDGVLPSNEAVCAIPNTLVALCLNAGGLQKVKDRQVLRCLITIFTSKQYLKALSGDTASIMGAGIDELFRHVPSLKDDGIQHVVVKILKGLCLLGGDIETIEEFTQDDQGMPEEVLERSRQPDIDSALPECISHAAKMLEALLSNSDTSRRFAQNQGVELLLKLYTLPKMPASFGSSSQSPPLLSIFRSLTHHNCPILHTSVPPVLAAQVNKTIAAAEKLGDECVPQLEEDARENYVRLVASASGLAAVAGTIARTSTPMLTEMCKGEKTLISALGSLERLVLHQLSISDLWKEQKFKREEEQSTMEGVEESEADRTDTEIDAMDIDAMDYLLPDLPSSTPGEVELQNLNSNKPGNKKAPDDLAHDVMQHFVATVRSVYTSLAKAVHTPARRREESFARPSLRMKVASLGLAMVLKDNLDHKLNKPALEPHLYAKHFVRLLDEVQMVLFDGRRHCCHTLILNYFVAVQGFASLLKIFERMVDLLWVPIGNRDQEAGPSEPADKPRDKRMVEDFTLFFLGLFSQLTNPRLLCQSAQTTSLLVVPLPTANETDDSTEDTNPEDAEAFVKNLQDKILQAVMPFWSSPHFAQASPAVTSSVIGILNSCLDGSRSLSAAFRAIRSDGRFGLPRLPPDPSIVQQIIDMGFSRGRAVQALRRIGQNSVELALEWLVSHPDEPVVEPSEDTQDQELQTAANATIPDLEARSSGEASRPTSESIDVQNLFSGALSVMEKSPMSAHSVSTLMMTLCNRNEGADQAVIVQWLVSEIDKTIHPGQSFDEIVPKMNATSHLLALIMSESVQCREEAIVNNMIEIAIRVLDEWERQYVAPKEVPMWIEAVLLVLDFLSQTQRRDLDTSSDDSSSSDDMSEDIDRSPLERIMTKWTPAGALDADQRFHLVEICIKLLKHIFAYAGAWSIKDENTSVTTADPAHATQAVLQLLASITRCHQTALKFLHGEGIDLLLAVPAACILTKHEPYIASILKNILEDDSTLQSLMESEIKNLFCNQRRPLGTITLQNWERLPLRNFLQKTSTLAYRSPIIFAKAVGNLCILGQSSGTQVISLKTNKPVRTSHSGESSKKGSKKVVMSFVEVIDKLLDKIIHFDAAKAKSDQPDPSKSSDNPSLMITTSRQTLMENRDAVVQAMVLSMLSEFCLSYNSTVGVLLKRDAELSQKDAPGMQSGHQGLIKRVLHEQLPWNTSSTMKVHLSGEASKFFQAICLKSSEGRRRILSEIVVSINYAADLSRNASGKAELEIPFVSIDWAPNGSKIKSFIELIGALLAAGTQTKSSNQSNRTSQITNGITVDIIRSMRQAGVMPMLIRALDLIDMDHPQSSKAIYSIIKPLEILTRPIPIPSKKPAQPQGEASANRPQESDQREDIGESPRRGERAPLDMMEEDLHDMAEDAQMYYDAIENLTGIVGDQIEQALHSNADDQMEEEDDRSESESSSNSNSDDTSNEEHVVVDEESEEIENDHQELDESDEDEDEEMAEEGEGSEDMEVDEGDEWDEDAAIREYTEALERIENVMWGAEDGDILNARVFTHGENMQPNLRSVLGNMLGNFLGPGDEYRDRRVGIRYRFNPRDRSGASNVYMVQPMPSAQHRLLVRPTTHGSNGEDVDGGQGYPELSGRRFGQIMGNEGRWRQLAAFQGLPTHFRSQIGQASRHDSVFVTGGVTGAREIDLSAVMTGERQDATMQTVRAAGTSWMQRMQGRFTELLQESLPREAPPPQPADEAPSEVQAVDEAMPEEDTSPEANPDTEVETRQAPPTESNAHPVDEFQMDVVEAEPLVEEPTADTRTEATGTISQDRPEADASDQVEPPESETHIEDQLEPPDEDEDMDAEQDREQNEEQAEDEPLPEEIVVAAEQAGVDRTFLLALPRPLQLEVLAERGVSISQLTNPSVDHQEGGEENPEGGVDPEFLAALPPDIREEVLESQRIDERRREVERQLTEGDGDDMANIIASLPDDIRAEVLLYSGPDILSNLPPNLIAEGQRIRERHGRHLFRDGDGPMGSNFFFRRYRHDGGDDAQNTLRKERKEDLEPPPGISLTGLTELVSLVHLNSPHIKNQLQKLFLNLCIREDSRAHIAQLLVQRLCDQSPSVTRRVLDMLSFLAKHQPSKIAEMLLEIQVQPGDKSAEGSSGKLPVSEPSQRALEVLLEMLGQPLCLRSASTLEQDLQLLEVILTSASNKTEESKAEDGTAASSSEAQDKLVSLRSLTSDQLALLPEIISRDGLSEKIHKLAADVVRLLVEVAPVHQVFLLTSLMNKMEDLTHRANDLLRGRTKDKLDRSSMNALGAIGALALRILRSVESLVAVKSGSERSVVQGVLSPISAALGQMWSSLGPVIAEVEVRIKSSGLAAVDANTSVNLLPNGAAQMLPFIESFFVLCNAQLQIGEEIEAQTKVLVGFAEGHRVLVNAFLRQTPALLEGSFKSLINTPRLIDFDNKRIYFRRKIRPEERTQYGTIRINVRREHVFEDSFYQLRHRSADELRCRLSVQFANEEGIDAGGVSREWYQVMAKEIFNPNLALFIAVPDGAATFQPNPNSIIQNDRGVNHLDFFKFVGRLVGKALYDGQLIDAHFTRSFYKHMLNQPLGYQDLEAVDLEFYKQMKWILENDITDVLVGQTFVAETDFFGRKEIVELKENGASIPITESNKKEYVNLMTKHKMTTAIRDQIKAFQDGFWELIPKELVAIFNDHELELMISGLPEVDISDLKANTEYSGYTAASQVIQWFWSVVEELDPENKALLLQFVTGTSKVPLDGFEHLQGISGPQKFQIHKSYTPEDRLPTAHTCFNQLDLPEYKSREQLKDRLMLAIHEGREGFAFG